MRTKGDTKMCLAVSAGGHASQLLKLEPCWEGRECFSVTTSRAVEEQLARFGRVYVVSESNRTRPLTTLRVLVSCVRIILRERPDFVISTGAAVGCIAGFVAKLVGAKIIWVDSIANVDKLSLSARLIRPFADLILTQWPDVALKYKAVEYVGHVV
jgi:UDP-N-acetylglucosamine:LPS N-acetylglucosamine transferase